MPRSLPLVVILAGLCLAPPARAEDPATPVLVGRAESYTPPLSLSFAGMLLEVPLQIGVRLESVSNIPIDRELTELHLSHAANVQARVGLRFNSRRAILPFNLGAEYEHDILTGPVSAQPELEGSGLPGDEDLGHQLRKGYGRISLGYYLHLIGGFNVSHWGMGLLANDGAHGWAPGSARFTDPRGGDRVLRLALSTGPLGRLGLQAAAGFDWVRGDDVMLEGDSARQVIGAITLGAEKPSRVGVYAAYRMQEDAGGDQTRVLALDLYARHAQPLPRDLLLIGELEAALVIGTSQLAGSALYPEKSVAQLGVAARATLEGRRAGAVIDFLYASGDADTDDDQQNAFKPDPNFDMGMVLYRQVLAAQTGRSVHTASDPELVGRPSEDLERFATRGSASNTVAFFPRVFYRPAAGLELYGGPLFAFTATRYIDPRNTRLAGGAARNPLDRSPGSFLGSELDVGLRYQGLLAGTLFSLGAEGGVLFPGNALQGENGYHTAVYGARLMAGYRF